MWPPCCWGSRSSARVHGRSTFGQIVEHRMNKPAFGAYPPRDDDLNRQLSLQKPVAFDVSMATELCDRQLVDFTRHPSVTLKRSFSQQRLLAVDGEGGGNGSALTGYRFSIRSRIWPKIDRPCTRAYFAQRAECAAIISGRRLSAFPPVEPISHARRPLEPLALYLRNPAP